MSDFSNKHIGDNSNVVSGIIGSITAIVTFLLITYFSVIALGISYKAVWWIPIPSANIPQNIALIITIVLAVISIIGNCGAMHSMTDKIESGFLRFIVTIIPILFLGLCAGVVLLLPFAHTHIMQMRIVGIAYLVFSIVGFILYS